MLFLTILTHVIALLIALLPSTLAAPTTNDPNLTPNPDLNLNLTLAATASCGDTGDMCSRTADCCYPDCCCMTSLDKQGDPFANYEGFCCVRVDGACPT